MKNSIAYAIRSGMLAKFATAFATISDRLTASLCVTFQRRQAFQK